MNDENRSLRTVVTQDGSAILDTCSGQITTLNATGAYIWRALEEGKDAPSIVALLAQETGEDLTVVERGVDGFLRELNQHHLRPR